MSPVTPTLGTHITQRRRELKIGQSAAARMAGVARSTWVSWETDANVPSDSKWSTIDDVCQWEPGSTAATLRGGQPTPRRAESPIPPAPPGIEPAEWIKWDPLDREMVLAAVRTANARAEGATPPDDEREALLAEVLRLRAAADDAVTRAQEALARIDRETGGGDAKRRKSA